MTIDTIRIIDSLLGRPLCLMLSAYDRLRRLFRRDAAGPVRRLLALKLTEQGATVLAYPALARAARLVGRENLYFCVFSDNLPILHILDIVPRENILVIRNNGFGAFLADVLRAMRKARAARIDTVVDLEFFSRASALLAYLSGATRRVGLDRFTGEGLYRGALMTHRLQFNPYLHTAALYDLLVREATADAADAPLGRVPLEPVQTELPPYQPDAAALEWVRTLLPMEDGGPVIVLNPNASDIMPLRKWPTERFVELGQRLLKAHPDAMLVLTGAAAEKDAAEKIRRAIASPRAISVAGQTNLQQLLALFGRASLLVTNDSGPGHFAAVTRTPAVVLFGPETPQRYGPMGDYGHVLWAGLACSPCITVHNHRFSPCRDNRCMQAITVDAVADAVETILNTRAAQGVPEASKGIAHG